MAEFSDIPEGFKVKQEFSDIPEGFNVQVSEASSPPVGRFNDPRGALLPLASSIIAEPVAGLAGIAGTIAGAVAPGGETGAEKGARFVEGTREALTIEPPNEASRNVLETVGGIAEGATKAVQTIPAAFASFSPEDDLQAARETNIEQRIAGEEKFSRILERGVGGSIGDVAFEATGSPLLAAFLSATPTAVVSGLGVKSAGQKLGSVSDDLINIARREGIDLADSSAANIERLRGAVAKFTDEQQLRLDAFESVGIKKPTTAQLTRDADDFVLQQETAKRSGPVRETLQEQEATLSRAFDTGVEATGGRAVTSGSSVIDEVVGRSTKLDTEISQLYNKAREAAPDAQNVDVSTLSKTLDTIIPSDRAMKGLPGSIRGNLKTRGIIDDEGNVLRSIDVTEAEQIRAFINDHFDSTSGQGRRAIRQLKESLDTDVFRAAGQDIFNEARTAKANFEQSLESARISKFDKNKKSLVRDILENKIDPDSLAESITSTKRYRAEDLRQLKDFLEQTDEGIAAFDDLRAQTLSRIKEKSFVGPEDASGVRALSRAQLEKELGRIGNSRMDVLFTQTERNLVNNILKVAKLREPVRGAALGQGPSAQAVNALKKQLAKNSIIANLFDAISINRNGQLVLRGKITPEVSTVPGAGALAVPAAQTQQ